MTRSRTAPHPRPPFPRSFVPRPLVPRPLVVAPAILLMLLALLAAPAAHAQGAPSGDYGELPLGGSVDGSLAAPRGEETVVFHTYTVSVPAGTSAITVRVDGRGNDVDLALRFGAPIVDYEDVDHLDVGADPDPVHTVNAPPAGTLYIDVLNLLPAAADYRLSVTADAAASAPESGAAGTPLAPESGEADPLLGEFEGDGLRVRVAGGNGSYHGELMLGGQRYPFEASGGNGALDGAFTSGGSSFPFRATVTGDALTVVSGGASYAVRRLAGGEGSAPAALANPLGDSSSAAPAPNDPVLAQGQHGTLSRDDALAFIEALEFSLAQVGYAQRFGEAERTQMLQAIAQEYPALEASEQAVLAQAREVWTRVQANWPAASQADREQFVVGVFVLAFGEEAVQRAMGSAGGGNGEGGAGCTTIDDCMGSYADPETYQDTMNAQSCWAAAGCGGYDPIGNDFSYDSYGDY